MLAIVAAVVFALALLLALLSVSLGPISVEVLLLLGLLCVALYLAGVGSRSYGRRR